MLKKFLITILLCAIILILGYGCFRYILNTPNKSAKEPLVIEIKEGTGTYELAKSIKQLGAIRSAWVFYLYIKFRGIVFEDGYYSLPYNLAISDLVEKFSSDELVLNRIEVPQGKRLEQIAAMLEDRQLFDYGEFVAAAKGKEGRLFPDVYYVPKKATASQFIRLLEENFGRKTSGLNFSESQLVLASIIERESVKDEERSQVAGIFQNRLDIGMRLESDPTVLYVNDSIQIKDISSYDATQYTFWKPIIFALYRNLDSPFNTYIYEGLPPKPICSPSLPSIKAAMNPEKHDYYFFFHDSEGKIYPSKNNTEHELLKDQFLK